MPSKRYTQQQLVTAIKESTSKRQALTKLGIAPKGGNYKVIDKAISANNIDTSHFTGRGWNKGKTFSPKRPIKDYLTNKYPIGSHKLRLRLLKENILQHKCSCCALEKWLDKPIPLELEHKDGNHENNQLSNLCLLCPNCHTLTPTYRGKNKKKP
jgi:hypothetical protein